jgi:hypothetical protein
MPSEPRKPRRLMATFRLPPHLSTQPNPLRAIKQHGKLLGLDAGSNNARDLATQARAWILRYYRQKNLNDSLARVSEEIALFSGLSAAMRSAMHDMPLRGASVMALHESERACEARLAELRALPARQGRREDLALRSLAPELMSMCRAFAPKATDRQILGFVGALLVDAGIKNDSGAEPSKLRPIFLPKRATPHPPRAGRK